MAKRINWGILSTGRIAHKFASHLPYSATGQLLAVGSRTRQTAEDFAAEFGAARAYGSYHELLADKDVQAVYISTPHPMHAQWAIAAARAGKHVLCEKPLTMNHPTADAVIQAARENDVFLMEAFMYRCHPQTVRLVELLREGVIGEVRAMRATFCYQSDFEPDSRIFAQDLGGGGILDIGCYCTSFARLVAGVARGGTVAEPLEVKAVGRLGSTGVDEWTSAVMKFPGDITAELTCATRLDVPLVAEVYGSKGYLAMSDPWIPASDGGMTKIFIHAGGKKRTVRTKTRQPLYAIEADVVGRNIDARQAPFPSMSWDDTLGNMKALDAWRDALGLVYDCEKPANLPTAHGGPLKASREKMKYGRIEGLDKPVARLIMGGDKFRSLPHAAVMLDEYFERGGNCVDTAAVYGDSEQFIGQWIKARGLRKEMLILDKGAHTPHCSPEGMRREHIESLERMQTDYVDIYMLHRDNLQVPVGEFIDVLDEHVRKGSICIFGASNWTLARLKEANAYARANGKHGFAVLSNNFSLASMVQPPWAGCLAGTSNEWVEFFRQTRMPLLPWSSQAQGFFFRGDPEKLDDAELVRCWYSEDNFQRLQRARELAAKHRVDATALALAYVLCQDFPTFPIIGPQRLAELASSFTALEVELSGEELRYLNLED